MLTPSEVQELSLLGYNGPISDFDSWAVKRIRSLLFTNASLSYQLEDHSRGITLDDNFDDPWNLGDPRWSSAT